MRFEKPKKKSGRPDFVAGRIAELERQLATETNEREKVNCKPRLTSGSEADRNQGARQESLNGKVGN
jgi:hypothetical protein